MGLKYDIRNSNKKCLIKYFQDTNCFSCSAQGHNQLFCNIYDLSCWLLSAWTKLQWHPCSYRVQHHEVESNHYNQVVYPWLLPSTITLKRCTFGCCLVPTKKPCYHSHYQHCQSAFQLAPFQQPYWCNFNSLQQWSCWPVLDQFLWKK